MALTTTGDQPAAGVLREVRRAPAALLGREEYGREFQAAYQNASGVVWKLERAQEFHEPYEPSWVAMAEGDWERSLRLIDERRGSLAAEYAGYAEFRRVRIVAEPLTPYLQWELHVLAARVAAGERARVLPATAIGPLEEAGPLPELLVFASPLMYEVRYDRRGAHLGGRRITDPGTVAGCRAALAALYAQGEDLAAYVRRAVEPLPPPAVRAAAGRRPA
ncbi:hypothetical protein Sru01_14130 [Sphaerisporangium rufum]|uniref:DUF6879 domain-containing protein n=1 Tax=Sphaerisporangium rufum TaxID=1381558 RepID=A0A919QYG8_9ACTN|nr:DUF6879 family protein [Sphaerisporangium rufum]GII76431.1 hypothetical protein Sru01_14130 [Sphaerisporangium rufum]